MKIEGVEYTKLPNGVMIPAVYLQEKQKIMRAEDVFPLCASIQCEEQECFCVLLLDGGNMVIEFIEVTKGLVNKTQVHAREVFKHAIRKNATSIILIHNHPSTTLEPSDADSQITIKMVEAGKLLGIPVLDHVIVGAKGFYSIRDNHPSCF